MVIASSNSATSLAGTWGEQQRKQYLFTNSYTNNNTGANTRSSSPSNKFRAGSSLSASRELQLKDKDIRFRTTSQSTYTEDVFAKSRDTLPTKHHKFKALQQTGSAVLAGQVYEGVDNYGFTTNNLLEEQNKQAEEKLTTTHKASYKPFKLGSNGSFDGNSTGFEQLEDQASQVDLHRTNSKVLRSTEAPMAVGRSGLRKEQGVSTSGLSGERLNLDPEPQKNSFANRAWLPYDDPALKIRHEGRPVAATTTALSIVMPAELKNDTTDYDPNKSYGRQYFITGNAISKTGAAMAGVFMDDFPPPIRK